MGAARPGKKSSSMRDKTGDAPSMRFVDFAVRAWREGPYAQVMAHSTPAGAMRQPVPVKLGVFAPDDYRITIDAPLARGAEVGRQLARVLFPPEIWRLLGESLAGIADRPDLGLRIRLCLDDDLIDLPWEFLYRPDVDAPAARTGFLLTDGRISLTREPPSTVGAHASSGRPQRGLFLGTMFDDGSDRWSVRVEHDSLTKAMSRVQGLLSFDFARADDGAAVERALAAGCDVFHYAGHTEVVDGRGTLIQCVHAARFAAQMESADYGASAVAAYTPPIEVAGSVESVEPPADWAASDVLAGRLTRAGTRLAVFNACNSGLWPFVRPLMRAGVPTVIGVQGLISNIAALNFAEMFYKSLAVGISLDEAMTYARLYIMEPERSYYPCDWGRFMAYMPVESAVLFPRPDESRIRKQQHEIRVGRKQTIDNLQAMMADLDGAGVSRMLSDVASRSVLILGRFKEDRKPVLDFIRREIATAPFSYVPILFDFERPQDRTMIESVLRFAAVSRFVIADLSDPKWVLAELQQIVRNFRSLPVVPIIDAGQDEKEVVAEFEGYASVHPVVRYRDMPHLKGILAANIVKPAEALYLALRPRTVI
jgi:CHAT domain-containing protein